MEQPSYPLYHDNYCPMEAGKGACRCNRKLVAFRRTMLKVFACIVYEPYHGSIDDQMVRPLPPGTSRHPGGRPMKYNAQLAIRIGLLRIMDKKTQIEALQTCGVSLSSVKRWRKKYIWFDEMIKLILKGQRDCPERFHKRVLTHRIRVEGGTLPRPAKRISVSQFKPEFSRHVQPSIRKTAKELGYSPTTVHRWANQNFLEFGALIAWARIQKDMKKFDILLPSTRS